MKKFLIILFILCFIGIAGFFGYQFLKKQPSTLPDPLQKLGYLEEEIKKINTLDQETIEWLKTIPYQKNLFSFLNHPNFDATKLKEYLSFSDQELDPEDILFIVNHHYQTETYDPQVLELMKEEYYVHTRLSRYIAYQKNHPELSNSELIKQVNSDLDSPFYENTENTDLTKGFLMIANKHYYLGNYIPEDLVTIDAKYGYQGKINRVVYEEYQKLYEAASKEGMRLAINSPYRSYQTQNTLYNNYAAKDGKKAADTYSARPGYSEHQTGLAMDITSKNTNFDTFEKSPEFKWMQEHAHEYGFILRYQKGQEYITGYMYEPWHYRYVGAEAATYIKEHNLTFEEYYASFVK